MKAFLTAQDREVLDLDTHSKPDVYGRDRLFVYLRLSSAPDAAQEASVDELERAGHPVVRIQDRDAKADR